MANEILKESGDEGIAIATGLKRARAFFAKKGAVLIQIQFRL